VSDSYISKCLMPSRCNLHFYFVTACNSTHGIAIAIPSIRQMRACIVTKRNNHLPISQHRTKQGYL